MKTIFIVMDSLNRHFLKCYNPDSPAITPNFDRLAARGVVFDRHYAGSLPCMPARREMMTGRINFLETPWGPIEPWDDTLPVELRNQQEVYSHMITDHYHYFHSGGDTYHTLFDSWEFERGQESDRWKPVIDTPKAPENCRGKGVTRKAYWANRSQLDPELDESYPTPRCFDRAAEFVELNHDTDNWHLHLEVFDPHEPFDSPSKYLDMYGDDWEGPLYNWPHYAPLDPELDDEKAVNHIRRRYLATLTMADYHLGKLLDKLDEHNMWDDTVVILSTDHGHLLGEHGYWAKNYMKDYQELVHIPMIICAPECKAGRVSSMTATIDIMPTLMELHNAELPEGVHGKSFLHTLEHPDATHNEVILYGYFGKDVNLFNGQYVYIRQPLAGSTVYSHTAMARSASDFYPKETLAAAENGVFLKHCHNIAHFRVPRESHRHHDAPDFNEIYDVVKDPGMTTPIHDEELELQLVTRMKELMEQYDAPESQFERLGLHVD
jgi:arylsulfatase A-like enzyme